MTVGIVILNYHSYLLSKELAINLSNYKKIDYIVIVDNNSHEDFSLLEKQFSKIYFISSKENGGYAKGNNIGLKFLYEQKHCDIAFIANPDVMVPEETINNIVLFLKDNEQYAIASSRRYYTAGKKTGQYWDLPSFKECFLESFILYAKRKTARRIKKTTYIAFDTPPDDNIITVGVVPGAFFGMKLDLIASINYLDENTFLYYEENILSKKLSNMGYKKAILTSCHYYHNHTASKRKLIHAKSYIKAKEYYVKKYLKATSLQVLLLKVGNFVYYIEFILRTGIRNIFKK